MIKRRLLTPGPTPVPEETLLELAKPVFFHRTKEFRQYLKEVLEGLQTIFCTQNQVLMLTSSGSGALEAALSNCVPTGAKVICLIAGRFGERWRNICTARGIEAISVTVPYGEAVQPEQLAQALADHPDAVAVCATLSETSTGVGHDIEAFGKLVAQTPALLLVDAVSGLVAMECQTDKWNIDVCCTGSQKALMMPPGLAFVAVSDKAWKAIDSNPDPRTFYFDLRKARASMESFDTPYTPAHTMVRAMRHSIRMIVEEGMENIWARHDRYARAARAGFQALGLELYPKAPNNALTVVKSPAGIDSGTILDSLEKQFGLKLANGQAKLKGTIFRLAHMGYIDQFDILAGIAGVEIVLSQLGHSLELGKGIAAAQKILGNG